MIRFLSTLLQLFLFFLFSLFVLLCFEAWTTSPQQSAPGFCGTTTLAELQGPDLQEGKHIFRNNCAACHAGDMRTHLTGPALGGALARWENHGGREALYQWIRNSQAMVEQGTNQRALDLWQEWGPTVMNSFENLSDEELDATMSYVEYISMPHSR